MFEDKRSASRFKTLLEAEIRPRKISPRNIAGVITNYSYDGLTFISEDFSPRPKEILEITTKNNLKDTNSHAVGEIVWHKQVHTRCYVGLKIKEASHSFTSDLSHKR